MEDNVNEVTEPEKVQPEEKPVKKKTSRPDKDVICDDLLTQAIYRIILCVISGLACVLTLGFFTDVHGTDSFTFSNNFWQYYTNLSNYYCFGISVAVLAGTVKKLRKGDKRGYNEVAPTLKFCGVVMIMVTFFVYMILLGDVGSPGYWNSLGNMTYHVVAPLLFMIDFFIFDKHKSIKILDPLKTLPMPLAYVVYILIYGAVCRSANLSFEYPYFFLNVDKLGYGGVAVWVIELLVIFTAVGYVLFVYDKLVKVNGKWKLDFKKLKLL